MRNNKVRLYLYNVSLKDNYRGDDYVVKKQTIDEVVKIVNKYEIQTMHSKEATLEEIFIQVTGRGLVYNETVK